ncbi:hypothetical protein IIA15_05320 [candidate division TA06 bacterium]|nr:hypothetical protein [candidate division TA06 bacterium]
MKEAEDLYSKIFFRTLRLLSEVNSFREVAKLGLETATPQIIEESYEYVRHVLTNPELDKVFLVDKNKYFTAERKQEFAEKYIQSKIIPFQGAVDAASLLFSHSSLDGTSIDLCRVCALIAPQDWEPFLQEQKATLPEIKVTHYDTILKQKIEKHLKSLDRDSLLKKIQRLYQICQPPRDFKPKRDYKYDEGKIKQLDRVHHFFMG